MKKLYGKPHHEIARIILGRTATLQRVRQLSEAHDHFLIKEHAHYAKLFPGIEHALQQLKKTHLLAVLSNCNHANILALLHASKLNKNIFHNIIGQNDVQHSKPYPDEIYKAEKLTHHHATYMIGDSIYDMIAARNAHIGSIGVLTGHYTKKQLFRQGAKAVIPSVNELPQLLNKLTK